MRQVIVTVATYLEVIWVNYGLNFVIVEDFLGWLYRFLSAADAVPD